MNKSLQSVLSLLRTDNLHILDAESARGFIVIINNNRVLKFCVLSDDNAEISEINKYPTTHSDFLSEANVQSRVHASTGVCPPVLSTNVLNNADSADLFWLVQKRCARTNNTSCINLFTSLRTAFANNVELSCGIIVMPYLTGVTLRDTSNWQIETRRIITANCIVNVMRLYRTAKMIHGDLHETNIIVEPESLECQFIDFGIVERVRRPELGTVTLAYISDFLQRMEPWLEFLSGDTTFYKVGRNRKRIYETELLQLILTKYNATQ